jgi:hypothetical protein
MLQFVQLQSLWVWLLTAHCCVQVSWWQDSADMTDSLGLRYL